MMVHFEPDALIPSPNFVLCVLISCVFMQGYTFLITSDYEREEWREIIREQQKKCKLVIPYP